MLSPYVDHFDFQVSDEQAIVQFLRQLEIEGGWVMMGPVPVPAQTALGEDWYRLWYTKPSPGKDTVGTVDTVGTPSVELVEGPKAETETETETEEE